jgi:zinc finger FYVE domain-containing protein 26
MLHKILTYAKHRLVSSARTSDPELQFSKLSAEAQELHRACDDLILRIELFQLLQSDGGSSISSVTNLQDLANRERLILLRDELIYQDRLQVALEICQRTDLPSQAVHQAMGLALLRAGQFNEAKEAFWTLKELEADNREFHQACLEKILGVLEHTESDHSFLASRYMQCIYYIKSFGTAVDVINFWLRHHLLEDAINYCCSHAIDGTLFLTTVVKYCAVRASLPTLQRLLLAQPRKRGHPFMLMVCRWLSRHQVWNVLLDWQVAMQDLQRASVSCLRLYRLEENVEAQKNYLLLAKKYAITLDSPETEFVRMISFQLELFEVLPPALQHLSLWNGAEDQLQIAIELLAAKTPYNDLAYRLMQEYRVPLSRAFATAAVRIAKTTKSTTRLRVLTGYMRGTVDDSEWDYVHEAIVKTFLDDFRDADTAANFAQDMHLPVNKVHALLACKKDKLAYVAAVHSPHHEVAVQLVEHIQKHTNSSSIKALCAKYLTSGGASS